MLRPDTFALTALLALLTAIGPLSVDLYLPSLPDIGRSLAASAADVQLTISSYLIGFALGQIVHGPLSDRYGRKPVMLAALIVFAVATLACALAPTIETLIAARLVQALGSSGAIVLARAVVRDLYEGSRAGRELSVMATIMGLAPVLGPVIGGVLQIAFGWRSNFVFILGAGLIAFVAVWRLLPETRRDTSTKPLALRDVWASYRAVAGHPGLRAHLGIITASFTGLFVFISGAPFVLQNLFHLSPFGFGIAFAIASSGYIVGTFIATQIVVRIGIDRTLGWGTLGLCAGGLAMVVATWLAPGEVAGIVLPMTLYLIGLGLTQPQALAGALQPFPQRAGAASSLVGFVQQSTAALAGAAVGHALGETAWPLAIGVALAGCLTLAIWAATRPARTQSGRAR
jgi:MFS transporter, DHA1 family, multidrug resistance protein